MRSDFIICFFLLFFKVSFGQNLVYNPGFEITNSCSIGSPDLYIDSSTTVFPGPDGWFEPTLGSPDYFNLCDPVYSLFGISSVNFHSGDAAVHMAFQTTAGVYTKELVSSKLLEPMQANECYYVSFFTRNFYMSTCYYFDNMGASFTVDRPSYYDIFQPDTSWFLPIPQIQNTPGTYLADEWIEVQGTFIATGGESYITLGSMGPNYQVISYSPYVIATNWDFEPTCTMLGPYDFNVVDDVLVMKVEDYVASRLPDTLICSGSTVTYSIDSHYVSILWSTGSTASSIDITDPGMYTVSVQYDCTTVTDTFFVDTFSTIGFHLPPDTTLCAGSLILLAPNGYQNYTWNGVLHTQNIAVNSSGLYVCEAASACTTYTDSIYVTFLSNPPELSLGDDTIICDSINIWMHAQPGYTTYTWNTGDTSTGIHVLNAGVYICTASTNCVTQTDTMVVSLANTIDHHLPNDTIVCSENLPFILSAPIGFDSYLWNTGSTSNFITLNTSGTYICNMFSTCGNFTDTFTLAIFETPTLDLGDDVGVCHTTMIHTMLDAGSGFSDFSWNTGDTSSIILCVDTGLYICQGSYTCGTIIDSISIYYIQSNLLAELKDTSMCASGFPILLSVNDDYDTYFWNTGDTQPSIRIDTAGLYILQVEDSCGVQYDSVHVQLLEAPIFTLGQDTSICLNDTTTQTYISSISSHYDSYHWSNGDTTYYTMINQGGTYWLEASNQCGTYTDTLNITACEPNEQYSLAAPTAFSPNDDGVNDLWGLQSAYNIGIHEIAIYDRWGEKIYSSNMANAYWDGTFRGKPLSTGVYVYYIDAYILSTGKKVFKKGNITIVK